MTFQFAPSTVPDAFADPLQNVSVILPSIFVLPPSSETFPLVVVTVPSGLVVVEPGRSKSLTSEAPSIFWPSEDSSPPA